MYGLSRRLRYEKVSPIVMSYMEKVFDERVRFGLCFVYEGERCVAFVCNDGLIGAGWPFRGDALRLDQLLSADTVRMALDDIYGDLLGGTLQVDALNVDGGNPYVDFRSL